MNWITYKTRACNTIPEFTNICKVFTRKFLAAGKSNSCVQNYLLQISKLALYYNRSPLELTVDEIEDYIVFIRENESPSLSSLKHLVCGLRHIFEIFEKTDLRLKLPSVRAPFLLPVVFSKEEIKLILKTPKNLKHRIILATIYDSGLRISEAIKLRIADVDLNRKMIHIRQSKCKKDRYVPISNMLVRGLKLYLETYKPHSYLFNGQQKGSSMTQSSIQRIMRNTLMECKIEKKASIHSLRHSYATHLLEDGLDIVSVKNQLGHVDVKTTMIYIHIAQISPKRGFSPLKTLYQNNFYEYY